MKSCIDCGKKVSKNSKLGRCKSCAKKGILSSRYVDGKFIQKIFNCLECGKNITHMALKGLCKSCSQKGKRSHSWKGGLPKCIDCGKELGIYAYNKKSRCRKCFGLSRRGILHPMYGKSPNWKRIKYKDILMRSTWEVAYAKYLDKQNIKWLYESKTFDLGNTTYTPDFYLPESNTYVEIKGWMRKKSQEKIEKFLLLFSKVKLILLDKKELTKFNIILTKNGRHTK
jgi:hypothetical protein